MNETRPNKKSGLSTAFPENRRSLLT